MKNIDPYAGNILIEPLGPILTRSEILNRMRASPTIPTDIATYPQHIQLHFLDRLRGFHEPRMVDLELQQTIDLMIRRNYAQSDPAKARTWASITGELSPHDQEQLAFEIFDGLDRIAVVVGPSGSGKTRGIMRSLATSYAAQVIVHPSFPKLVGSHTQVVWLSINIPASGKAYDLAWALMKEWDRVMAATVPDYQRRFNYPFSVVKASPSRFLSEWRHVARSHFLGVLHLDEVQNLFRIASLSRRKVAKKNAREIELSLVEDETLKWILEFANVAKIPLVLSGTPDGISALTTRQSTGQRLAAGGSHIYLPFSSANDPMFDRFLKKLTTPGFLKMQIEHDELRKLVFSLTAGIPRLIVALWISAHRVAFREVKDPGTLKSEHFQIAIDSFMAPVKAAVAALLSGDPDALRRFEDLLPRDNFWMNIQ